MIGAGKRQEERRKKDERQISCHGKLRFEGGIFSEPHVAWVENENERRH